MLGIVHLYVNINGYCVKQPFVVVKELSCDVLLGTTFIDNHTENIWVRQRVVVLRDGTTAPIERRQSRILKREDDEPIEVPKPKPPPRLLRVTHTCTLPPQSETVISVVLKESGTFLLESSQKLYNKNNVQ